MKRMIELIEDTPWGVVVAIVFLLAMFVTLCFVVPWVGLSLGAGIGTFLSILRVMHYLNHGN
jgi:hypothetical protein